MEENMKVALKDLQPGAKFITRPDGPTWIKRSNYIAFGPGPNGRNWDWFNSDDQIWEVEDVIISTEENT